MVWKILSCISITRYDEIIIEFVKYSNLQQLNTIHIDIIELLKWMDTSHNLNGYSHYNIVSFTSHIMYTVQLQFLREFWRFSLSLHTISACEINYFGIKHFKYSALCRTNVSKYFQHVAWSHLILAQTTTSNLIYISCENENENENEIFSWQTFPIYQKTQLLPTNTIEGDFHRMLASKEMCEITENVLKAQFVYKNAFSE